MPPLTACPSPPGETPEGTREPQVTTASLTETHSGQPAVTNSEGRDPGSLSEASSGPKDLEDGTDHQNNPSSVAAAGPTPASHAADQCSATSETQEDNRPDQPDDHQDPSPTAMTGRSTGERSDVDGACANPAHPGEPEAISAPVDNGMGHFQRLRRRLLVSTLLASSAAVPACWLLFDLPAAMSLLVGSIGGLLYLVLLARSVSRLGGDKRSVGKIQLLVPVVLVLASARIPQLELVPALVGFLLYKPALLVQAYLDR